MLADILTCCNLVPQPLEFVDIEANIQVLRDETETSVLCRRRDSHSEWADYDPNTDDYDVTTAALLPALEAPDTTALKQISALQGRIRRGGDSIVLQHYQCVIQELQQAVPLVSLAQIAEPRRDSKHWGSDAGSESGAETASTCLNDEELLVEETESKTSEQASRSSRDSLRGRVPLLGRTSDDQSAIDARGTQFGENYL